ncbi:MAG: ABC transporter ATP-binding protein, partial [Alphaproteobacteria bacterium]
RAMVVRPKVLLFDEPLSNLDAKLRVQMRAEIRELHQRLKATTIYVTHDQIEAMTMADKIVVMQDGQIEQIATPLELYDQPANTFVAGFIGSPAMNLIPATVQSNDDSVFAQMEAGKLEIPTNNSVSEGQKIILGIRPEVFVPSDVGLNVTVAVVEPTGAETHLVTRSDGQEFMSVLRERSTLKIGQQINLAAPKTSLHIFDAKSGDRLERLS